MANGNSADSCCPNVVGASRNGGHKVDLRSRWWILDFRLSGDYCSDSLLCVAPKEYQPSNHSNLNLADDAAHRKSLALTYMGLLQDEKHPASDQDRAIILNALFRPIPPQTNDEGPPAGLIGSDPKEMRNVAETLPVPTQSRLGQIPRKCRRDRFVEHGAP